MIKRFFLAFKSIFLALSDVMSNSKMFMMALRPWIIGFIVYLLTVTGSFFFQKTLIAQFVNEPNGPWSSILYGVAWIFVTILILLFSTIVSAVFMLVFSAVLQTRLVCASFQNLAIDIPPDQSIVMEAGKAISFELVKLLWIIPITLTLIIVGLFPLLLPFTLTLMAWILGYQFYDLIFDIKKIPPFARFKMAIKDTLVILPFGFIVAILWSVPFVSIIFAPIVGIAMTRYLKDEGVLV